MRRVCAITGTRAEFGLLQHTLQALHEMPGIKLQIIATGAHLVKSHGMTIHEILDEGFHVDAEVDMLLASDQPRAIGQALGLGVIGLTTALDRLRPELVIILGDRYEALAAAQAAMMLGIPIAHLHGGEATEGLIDEAIRHSITKMAHLHFVATEKFRERVIQLGEQPQRVYNVGAAGLDNIATLETAPKEELEAVLGIRIRNPVFLVTYHPVTLSDAQASGIDALLHALESYTNATVVFTGANADALGEDIRKKINDYCIDRSESAVQITSLGFRNYLSLMRISSVVVGNSSSGIIEAPSMGVPTVNLGVRQKGRPRAPSIIDCEENSSSISAALDEALTAEFQKTAQRRETPYGLPGAGNRIASIIQSVDLEGILFKEFYEI